MTLARREREKEARRQTILHAAQRVMVAQGFDGMTMSAVAKDAEVSKGTVYLYFDSKDALCAALACNRMQDFLDSGCQAERSATTGLEAIGAMLKQHAETFQQHPHHLNFMVSWMLKTEIDDSSDSFRRYREYVGKMLGLVVSTLARGVQDGSIRSDIRPMPQALELWASFVGILLFRHAAKGIRKRIPAELDMDDMLTVHVEHVLRGLSSKTTGPSIDKEKT